MSGIFISYRREDSAGYAGRLYDRLRQHFGADHIFMDVETEPGVDFVVEIDKAIGACDAVLVVIGRRWLESKTGEGLRLDDPKDFVRLEVATALQREAKVVPVLVGGAVMPTDDQLPDVLKPLVRRQAVTLADEYWDLGVQDLMQALDRRQLDDPDRILAERRAGGAGVQRSRKPWLIASLVVLASAAGIAGWRWVAERPSAFDVAAEGPIEEQSTGAGPPAKPGSAASPAALRFDPPMLDFGERRVNTSSAETVAISNTGGSPATVREIKPSGPARDISLAPGACAGNTIVSGERCTIDVYFVPRQAGLQETTITVIDTDGKAHPGPRVVGEGTLAATGVEPATIEVPRLVRLSYEQAFFALGRAGLAVGNVSLRGSDKVPSGMVLQQLTQPGLKVRPSTAIDFVVSVQAPKATVLTRGPPAAASQGAATPQILLFVHDPTAARLCYGVAGAAKVRIEPTVGPVRPLPKDCVDIEGGAAQSYTLYASSRTGQTVKRTLQANR